MSIKLAVFDMDGTITLEKSSWEYVHKKLDLWDSKGRKHLELFLQGKISYNAFCQLDAMEWAGIPYYKIKEIVENIPLRAGVKELFETLKKYKVYVAIISTGLSILAEKICKDYGLDFFIANELEVKGGLLSGKAKINVSTDVVGIKKKDYLLGLINKLNINKNYVMSVGDSLGDKEMFEESGHSFFIAERQENNIANFPPATYVVDSLFKVNDFVIKVMPNYKRA